MLSQLENIFRPTAKFERVLNPDNPNEGFGDITKVFGGHGNFKGYVSEKTKDDFLNRIAEMMNPKEIPNGIRAVATVVYAQQEKMRIMSGNGASDMCRMTIQVTVAAQDMTWDCQLEDMIPRNQVALFQPGYTFDIKYDPKDSTNICFDRNQEWAN